MKALPYDPTLKRMIDLAKKERASLSSNEDRVAFLSDLIGELQTLLEDELESRDKHE